MPDAGMQIEVDLSPEEAKAMIQAQCRLVKNFVEQEKISLGKLADELGQGYSTATISQVLNGKYSSDPTKILEGLRAWMDRFLRRRKDRHEGIVATEIARTIAKDLDFIAATANPDRPSNIAIITGPAGCGKTIAQKYWAKNNPGTIYIDVRVGDSSPRGFLYLLCDELRIQHTSMLRPMMKAIEDKLKGSCRVILVDEAHKLFDDVKNRYQVFEVIRDIHDMTGCPIVLFGTSLILRTMEEGLRETRGFRTDQFNSRVRLKRDLLNVINSGGGGKLLYSTDEIRDMFKKYRLKLHPAACKWLAKLASTPRFGMLRTITTIMDLCEYCFADELITLDMAKAAYKMITNEQSPAILDRDLIDDEGTDGKAATA